MSGVLDFVARVLEREGALVEAREDGIETVLPENLREALGFAEFTVLAEGDGGEPCGYGTEALGRIARLALGSGRTAAFRADLPEPRVQEPGGFEGLNVALRPAGARAQSIWTLVGFARHRATSDDQREGVSSAAVSAPSGVPVHVPDLEPLPLSRLGPEKVPAEALRAAFPRLLGALRARCVEDLRDFREAVAKRRERDAERLRKYFDDLAADLRRRLRKSAGPLRAKLDALPAELARKLAELDADATVRVRIELAGLIALEGPGVTAELEVRRRKHTRLLEVSYDGIARRWRGLRCDGCGTAAWTFALCDEAAHVLCPRCWDACGTGGHRPCFRCKGKPERTLWVPPEGPRPRKAPET
ncbi:MAG: hypothetical protein ACUVYA_19445, partial [Planctomycetota bacterium]